MRWIYDLFSILYLVKKKITKDSSFIYFLNRLLNFFFLIVNHLKVFKFIGFNFLNQ